MKNLTCATILVLSSFCTSALANNGMETFNFEEPRRFFVPCLAEFVSGTLYISANTHYFETPSGTVHFVENWRYVLQVSGEATGRMWIGNGVAPFTDNLLKNSEKLGFTDKVMMKPVDDGPKWRWNFNSKAKFDENGDLVSLTEEFATDEFFRCLGPK